ncbi:MAG: hypothetical protein ABIR63_08055 [Sphingomicrobium sp.]
MNPWPFVTAAYALTIGVTVALLLGAWIGMRRAEAAADEIKRR